jgi:hypothetical protein
MAMPPEQPCHLGIRVTCHVIPSVLWAHHDVSMTSSQKSAKSPKMHKKGKKPLFFNVCCRITWSSAEGEFDFQRSENKSHPLQLLLPPLLIQPYSIQPFRPLQLPIRR